MRGILITGASGFLGRALQVRLAGDGHGLVAASRRSMPGHLKVADYGDCPPSALTVHLAEEPDRAKVNAQGAAYMDACSSSLRRLLARTPWLVYVSSGSVYGDGSDQPLGEDAPVVGADTYAQAKLYNEKLVLQSGGTVLRLSNLFGKGMSSTNVLSDISSQLQGCGPLKVRDEHPVRDFLHADEAAQAISLCLQLGVRGVLNLGSGVGLSVRQVAQLALRVVDQPDRPIESTRPAGRRSTNILDISLARQRLGWQPSAPDGALCRFFSTEQACEYQTQDRHLHG